MAKKKKYGKQWHVHQQKQNKASLRSLKRPKKECLIYPKGQLIKKLARKLDELLKLELN